MQAYLMKVTAAALIAALAKKLSGGGTVGTCVKTILGIFMALTVFSPLVSIQLQDLDDFHQEIHISAQEAVAMGEESAREALTEGISEKAGAYILNKAALLGVDVEVSVHVSGEEIPVPAGVTITGKLSPFARQKLTRHITEDLGIDLEEIEWIS